jgi:hypothetical protein
VQPLTFQEARKTKNYAPWVVHRLSSDAIFAEWYERAGDWARLGDPGAATGFDGAHGLDRPNTGFDWWRLSQHLRLLHGYPLKLHEEIIRSFAPRDSVRGMWYGTYKAVGNMPNTIEHCHFFPWHSAFHSLNTSWWWTMGQPGPVTGYAPDLTNLPFFEARTRALEQIKGGIGKLLLACERENDRIAIHWSQASRITECFYKKAAGDWCDGHIRALRAAMRMLEDAGFQYEFVSYEEVEGGVLESQGYRAFFMPHSRAVSADEAKAIRSFVQSGGVVLADIVPGRHNGRGTLVEDGMLADLYPTETAGSVTEMGEGRSVLYGTDLNDYGDLHDSWKKDWKALDRRWEQMAAILSKHAGLNPTVQVKTRHGGSLPPTEISRFNADGPQLIGLLRFFFMMDHKPYPATIEMPREGFIYDVRRGTLLGHADQVEMTLDYEAQLLALSPYKIEKMVVDAADTAHAGGTAPVTMRLQTSDGSRPGIHVFRLTVTGPDGAERDEYGANVLAVSGAGHTAIPFALNDPAGRYTLRVRDVMSGVTAEHEIRLRRD